MVPEFIITYNDGIRCIIGIELKNQSVYFADGLCNSDPLKHFPVLKIVLGFSNTHYGL